MKVKTRKFVEVFYDPERSYWNVAIEKELKRLGLKHGDVTILVKPKKTGQKNE